MEPRRLRAPSADGALLADPPLGDAPALLAANAARLSSWDYDFQGRPASALRLAARSAAIAAARRFLGDHGLDVPSADVDAPLVVTGHQPELFHPGVWVKNFAAGSIARAVGGSALNFQVDDDIPKALSTRVPGRRGVDDDGSLVVRPVAFDVGVVEVPYEDLAVRDEAAFAGFAARARDALDPAVAGPILGEFWASAVARRVDTDRVGLRFALARREFEGRRGLRNLEVPLSVLCESEPHAWFVSHILANLGRFRDVHNASLASYRAAYGIRSTHHPVPELAARGDWLEAPFWAWRASSPRRQPLMARQDGRKVELRIGAEGETFADLPLGEGRDACCAVERLLELPAQGIRIRTRALTTTMYARLLLGDLFIHGIGGAKYDELGDEVVRGFFGIEPPAYATMSMTLRLPLAVDAEATPLRLGTIVRSIRDAAYNPERLLADPTAEDLRAIAARREAIAMPASTHAERLARFKAIRRATAPLAARLADEAGRLGQHRDATVDAIRQNRTAISREYASVLHPEGRLLSAMHAAVGDWSGPA